MRLRQFLRKLQNANRFKRFGLQENDRLPPPTSEESKDDTKKSKKGIYLNDGLSSLSRLKKLLLKFDF